MEWAASRGRIELITPDVDSERNGSRSVIERVSSDARERDETAHARD